MTNRVPAAMTTEAVTAAQISALDGRATSLEGRATALENRLAVIGTPQATTSGTTRDFNIPSYVRRFTLSLTNFSTNGTSIPLVQLGTVGGIDAASYVGGAATVTTGTASNNHSSGFNLVGTAPSAATVLSGSLTFTLVDAATFTWAVSGNLGYSNVAGVAVVGGHKALAGALTQVRLTTTNGTDAFDLGAVNVHFY
jgi:hypothetical protein